jgi:protein-L-isoaspartate O-methyltransferase
MKLSFAEYDSSTGPAQLHIIVRGVCDQSLADRLGDLADCAGVDSLGEGILAVRADYDVDMDDFLRRASRLINEGGAEIVESRLSATAYQSGPVAISSPNHSGRSANFFVLAPGMSVADDATPLYMESGTAFGSGQHPSTKLAVAALEDLVTPDGSFPCRALDIGCGSGILSLVCAKLGAEHVMGLDINPEALAAARHNAQLNGEDDKIIIADSPLSEINQHVDLVVANISPFVLLGLIPDFAHLLSPNGFLVLAGMRQAQLGDIRRVLTDNGLTGSEKKYESGQWAGLLITRR